MQDNKFHHHQYLGIVANADVDLVTAKDLSYGASWKKRGGVGAFMMLARKWDRLEAMLVDHGYDVFAGIESGCEPSDRQGADGTVLAEVRDLRRYLLLVEAEMVARGHVMSPDVAALGAKRGDTHPRLVARDCRLSPSPEALKLAKEHSASRLPLVPRQQYITGQQWGALPPALQSFYVAITNAEPGGCYGLPDFVSAGRLAALPSPLDGWYLRLTDDWYAMDRALVPEGALSGIRGRWRRRLNSKEVELLPAQEQALYVPGEPDGRVLRPELVAQWGQQ